MPSRQTPKQKEYEARVKAIGSEMANERAKKLSGQFIKDMHTHFLSDDTRIQTFIAQRESVGKSSRWIQTSAAGRFDDVCSCYPCHASN